MAPPTDARAHARVRGRLPFGRAQRVHVIARRSLLRFVQARPPLAQPSPPPAPPQPSPRPLLRLPGRSCRRHLPCSCAARRRRRYPQSRRRHPGLRSPVQTLVQASLRDATSRRDQRRWCPCASRSWAPARPPSRRASGASRCIRQPLWPMYPSLSARAPWQARRGRRGSARATCTAWDWGARRPSCARRRIRRHADRTRGPSSACHGAARSPHGTGPSRPR